MKTSIIIAVLALTTHTAFAQETVINLDEVTILARSVIVKEDRKLLFPTQ